MLLDGVQLNVDLNQILSDLVVSIKSVNGDLFNKGFKDSGNNIMVQCPYHSNGQEKRPSAGIHKETGVFHCFACGETHSLQEFISHCFGYDDGGLFGWKWLLKNYVSVRVEDRKDVELNFERTGLSNSSTLGNRNVNRDNHNFITEEELDSYRYVHPYMYKRGLTDEVIELFDIGYDKSRRCITFPVRDIKGHCLFVARRSVDYKYFNYPSGVEKPLYGLYELHTYAFSGIKRQPFWHINGSPQEVIVCESMLDALSFWTVNKYAVALNGTGSSLQFKQLRELPCRKLILCTDMDNAGMKARTNIRKNVTNKIITEYILPNGRKDANECTKEELKMLKDVIA